MVKKNERVGLKLTASGRYLKFAATAGAALFFFLFNQKTLT